MTKEKAIELGISAQKLKDMFEIIGAENTQIDPIKCDEQTRRYETARVEMWEAINRRDAALAELGKN